MNWVGWLLFAACCAVCLVIGWAVRGYAYERGEVDGG